MSEPYLKIPYALFKMDMTPIERYILALTISYGGTMWLSNTGLANLLNVDRRSIINAVNKLVKRKYIKRDQGKNNRTISLESGEIISLLKKPSSEEITPLSGEVFSQSGEKISHSSIYSKVNRIEEGTISVLTPDTGTAPERKTTSKPRDPEKEHRVLEALGLL